MVLTVTINPLLERRYYYHSLNLSSVNRNGKLIIKAGGKGINVNRQLNKLGIKNIALLFIGGSNGKLMRDSLRSENISFSEVVTKSETRDAAVIVDQSSQKLYSFFGTNPSITANEVTEFILKLEKAIAASEIVVFSGSSPCKEAESIFAEGIKIANRLDKISVCDTYGNHLGDCYDSSPTIVHNNSDEINSSLGSGLNSEPEYLKLLDSLYKKGIKQSYLTNGKNPVYASNFDFHYKVAPPEIRGIDSTGSGDAFVAGIVYGWHKKLSFVQQLRFATALGALNAKSTEVCQVEPGDAESLAGNVKVEVIGKKLNEADDSPL
jgi:1-phosphofructokinase family hexose kinase